jgi:shikimate kinase
MAVVTLVGYRGTGKSTVAALLAERLGCGWIDADVALEERLGMTIADLVRERGEPAFRDAEAALLADLLPAWTGVFSTGGGVVLRPANRALLLRHGRPVVWLSAAADVIRRRLAADPATVTQRPALAGGDPLDEVERALRDREPLYREVADAMVDTGASEPPEVVRRITGWLAAVGPDGGSGERAC